MTTSSMPQQKKSSVKPYTSNETIARLTITGLALYALLGLISIVNLGFQMYLISKMMNDEFASWETLEASDSWQQIILIGVVITFLLTAIFFSVWFYRAYRNLTALGARGLHTTPGWAVAYFYIPIVNLFRPYKAAKEIWQASIPTSEPSQPQAWQEQKVSSIVAWWWGFWIMGTILGRISNRLSSNVESLSGHWYNQGVDLAIQIILIIAAILAIFVVKNITAMQEERYRRIQPWMI